MHTDETTFTQPEAFTPKRGPEDLSDLFLRQHTLEVRCKADPQTGRLRGKIETTGHEREEFAYRHDAQGRLICVHADGYPVERYEYNESGQRVRSVTGQETRSYHYDDAGRLERAGEARYAYDASGNLARKTEGRDTTVYTYEDTRLARVDLPDGSRITYTYPPDSPCPMRRYRNGTLTAEYEWNDLERLASCVDHEQGLVFSFVYDDRGALSLMRLTGRVPEPALAGKRPSPWDFMDANLPPEPSYTGLQQRFGPGSREGTFLCGCDQVGTLKLVTLKNGKLIKRIRYDSFGNMLHDDTPDLFIPVGFAGGLTDRDTGLIRFGYRDYDPLTGRFTSPDPLGDTGGDHDLYDYCVDDPVTMRDGKGLFATPATDMPTDNEAAPRSKKQNEKPEQNLPPQAQQPSEPDKTLSLMLETFPNLTPEQKASLTENYGKSPEQIVSESPHGKDAILWIKESKAYRTFLKTADALGVPVDPEKVAWTLFSQRNKHGGDALLNQSLDVEGNVITRQGEASAKQLTPVLRQHAEDHLRAYRDKYKPDHERNYKGDPTAIHKMEALIKNATWIQHGDNYMLVDNGKPVLGLDGNPIAMNTKDAQAVAQTGTTKSYAMSKEQKINSAAYLASMGSSDTMGKVVSTATEGPGLLPHAS
ncbi:hypothetical protein LJC26_08265, partial [Desulfovibrio sp. OttesenSCG-928-O18]|nr:hypothetical protein [Desulfovibrio sp. OttesenSCG-928-O18]